MSQARRLQHLWNADNLRLCSLISLARRRFQADLIPKRCTRSSAPYQNAVAGEIVRLQGHVAKFMGDGVLPIPAGHRHTRTRPSAQYAPHLEFFGVLPALATPAKQMLLARIGIATGLVVVGDIVGEGAAQERAVVGDTPNLAARLQAFAQPGSVVVAESTRQLLGDLFEFEECGPREIREIDKTVRSFVVTREGQAESRFEALHRAQLDAPHWP